eukprot:TRINITY_DN8379_c0_g1_i1.p2 TRINITY_DN8379_c0_g1~~TRINITY_DN8379_c0_g1_i1.p2  ORF type:complete len:354 (-),score=33.00 TRINITY_DN8379_c0_g1_i1:682-1743(-)
MQGEIGAAAQVAMKSQQRTADSNPYSGVSLRSAAKNFLNTSQPANSSSSPATPTTTNSPLDRSVSNISEFSETASSSGSTKVRSIQSQFGGSVIGSRSPRRASSTKSAMSSTPKLDLAKIRTELRSRGDQWSVSVPCSPTSTSKASESAMPTAHSSSQRPIRRAESLCIDGNGRKWRYLVRAESLGLMRPVQFTPRAQKPLWMRSERERRRRVAAEARRKWNMSDYAQSYTPKQSSNALNKVADVESTISASSKSSYSFGLDRSQSTVKFGRTLSKFKVLEDTEYEHLTLSHSLSLDLGGKSGSLVGDKTSQLEASLGQVKMSEARERVRKLHSTKSQLKELRDNAMKIINDD